LSQLKHDLASLRIERSRMPGRRRTRALWIGIVLFFTLAAGAAWRFRDVFQAVEVETARPTVTSGEGPAAGTAVLTASGYVVARRKAVVSAKIQGRLAELRVEEGSRVKKGDILARLESAEQEAQLERSKALVERMEAELAEEERKLKVSGELQASGVIQKDDVDAAQSRVKIATAALRQARAEVGLQQALLENTLILAPFDGVVVKKMAEVGESVAPIPPGVNISVSSGAIVAMADLDTLEVDADVGEAHVAKLETGQPAQVVVEAIPDRKYRASIRQVIPTADRTKSTVTVKVTILDKDEDLKPEMSARVTFLAPETGPESDTSTSPRSVITLPSEAVVTREGKPSVLEVVDGSSVMVRAVVPGGTIRGQVVIRQGLQGSEIVVLRPPEGLGEGDRVKVKAAAEELPGKD
jgi:HlyD family secretion protein